MEKYLILDFGRVLAYPTTGNWQITPKFMQLVNIETIDKDTLKKALKKHKDIISCGLNIKNCDDEYKCMLKFYEKILLDCNVHNYQSIAKDIAYNFVYEFDKYKLYNDVKIALKQLSDKYKLILLSDNWPCIIDYMKEKEIFDYFEKIYVSSIYGQVKEDKLFFDNPIRDFNIKKFEAIFIDDNENLLNIAVEKGMKVKLMDREKKIINSKYDIIYGLDELL